MINRETESPGLHDSRDDESGTGEQNRNDRTPHLFGMYVEKRVVIMSSVPRDHLPEGSDHCDTGLNIDGRAYSDTYEWNESYRGMQREKSGITSDI